MEKPKDYGLPQMGIEHQSISQRSIEEIYRSIRDLGALFGASSRAEELEARLKKRVKWIHGKVSSSRRPTVLVAFNRNWGEGLVASVFSPGPKTFVDDLIRLAGGQNVCRDLDNEYPQLTHENILRYQPDMILDINTNENMPDSRKSKAVEDWKSLPGLSAYSSGNIHVLTQDCLDKPSTRFDEALEIFAKIIHPEVDWNKE